MMESGPTELLQVAAVHALIAGLPCSSYFHSCQGEGSLMQPLGLPQHSEHHTLHSASPGRAHSRRRPARADAPSSQSPHASRQQQLAPCSQQPAAASSQQRGRQLLRALRSVCEQLQGQIRPGKRRRASRAPLFAAINWRPWAAKGPDTSGLHGLDTQEIFDSLDRNHDSFLDAKELSAGLHRLGLPCSPAYLQTMMRQYDENHDGLVDAVEFQHYISHRQRDLERAFDRIDTDHQGKISATELLGVMKRGGLPASMEDCERMVGLLDGAHQGGVSFQDFTRFVALLPEAQVKHDNVVSCWLDSADWLAGLEYRLCMTPPKQPLQRLLAGGVAGAVSRTVVAPFERLRTVMMTDSSTTFFGAAENMWREGGLRGLFKGNTLTVLKSIPQSAIQFAVFDQTKDLFLSRRRARQPKGSKKEPRLSQTTDLFLSRRRAVQPKGFKQDPRLSQVEKLLSGVAAGVTACLLTFPLETMRTCRSLSGSRGGIPALCRDIYAQRGWKTFYRGLGVGMVEEGITSGLGFMAYEIGQQVFTNITGRSPTTGERGIIGGFTACLNMGASLPLVLIQRKMQVQGIYGNPVRYSNALDCARQIVAEQGVRGLYRGLTGSILKVAPSIGVMYALYAVVIQQWGVGGLRAYPHGEEPPQEATA